MPSEQAFPIPAVGFPDGSLNRAHPGMTLRDYIAIQSITGAVVQHGRMGDEHIAKAAYKFADAMLAARKP